MLLATATNSVLNIIDVDKMATIKSAYNQNQNGMNLNSAKSELNLPTHEESPL